MRIPIGSALVALLLSASASAQTQGSKIDPGEAARAKELVKRSAGEGVPYARHRLIFNNLTAFRWNPVGLEDQLSVSYRYRLWNDASPLLKESYLGVSFAPTLSPTIVRLGGNLEIRPLTVLLLSAGYYQSRFFGTFGFPQDFTSPSDDFSDSALDDGEDFAMSGQELQLRAQVLFKVGPIVVRNDTNFYRFDYSTPLSEEGVPSENDLFYHIRLDLLVENEGWAYVNDSDALYLSSDGSVVLGLRNTVSHAFYSSTEENPNSPTVRLGPLFAYRFYDDPQATWFNKPTLLIIAQWWLDHRFRTGDDVNQGVPYFVAGLRFEGDLWESN